MTTPATDSTSGRQEEFRFLLRLGLLFAASIGGLLLLLSLRSQLDSQQFPRVKLPDGTWLVARAVTVGTRHAIKIPYPFDVQYRRWQRGYDESYTTAADRMVIWLTRQNDHGDLLDLDWLRRCELVTPDDWRTAADRYHRQKNTQFGSSGSGAGSPGFTDARPFGSTSEKLPLSLIRFELPLVRPRAGTMALDVRDGGDQVVARLDLPFPRLPNIAPDDWQPDSLPATRTDGNLSVTLNGVTYARNPDGELRVSPQLTYVHDGQPTESWLASDQLQDPLGNVSSSWNCDLSPGESAWKLKLTMHQAASGRLPPQETMKLPVRALAAAGQLAHLSESYTVNGVSVSLAGWGGTGPVEFRLSASNSQFKTARYQPGQFSSGMSSSCTGNRCDVEFSTGRPFLITSDPGPEHNLQLVFRDQDGEVLAQPGWSGIEGLRFWFFEPRPTSTSVEIEIVVQRLRHAEFLIAPPAPGSVPVR